MYFLKQPWVNLKVPMSDTFPAKKIIKSIFPLGLYGRVYLILFFPVVLVLLVGSFVFIQRHFDYVTRQMISNINPHFSLIITEINEAGSKRETLEKVLPLSKSLSLNFEFLGGSETIPPDRKLIYDFSGRIIIASLKEDFPDIVAIDLLANDGKILDIYFKTNFGNAKIMVPRRALSPSNPHQFLILILFTAILTTLIAVLFLKNQLRPIKRLSEAAEAFGKGQFYPLRVSGAREVKSAIRAFLTMQDSIEKQISQRSHMLASISHDLRTPLTRLRLGVEFLEESKYKDLIIDDIEVMDNMLTELLEFSRTGKSEPFEDIDPFQLAESIHADASRQGVAIEIQLISEINEPPSFRCKPSGIRRSIENLIQNAEKFSSKCLFSVYVKPESIQFIIEDNGPGIERNKQKIAKTAFVKFDEARNLNHFKGVGLGLAIVSNIARDHGGELILEKSEKLGGLKAVLSLPNLDGRPGGIRTPNQSVMSALL